MRIPVVVAALIGLLGWIGTAGAQENPLVGTWKAVDPSTGNEEQLIVGADHLQFGPDEPSVPYSFEQSGDVVTVHIKGGAPPLTFKMTGADKAELTPPGGPTIPLTRVAAAPSAAPAEQQSAPGQTAGASIAGNMMDEIAKTILPHGVPTRFEPLNQSLEQLLSGGWKLDQASGGQGAFTLLLSKGPSNALCIVAAQTMGDNKTALCDCRRLN